MLVQSQECGWRVLERSIVSLPSGALVYKIIKMNNVASILHHMVYFPRYFQSSHIKCRLNGFSKSGKVQNADAGPGRPYLWPGPYGLRLTVNF